MHNRQNYLFLETDSKFIKTEITKRFNSTKSILKFKEKQILKEIEQEITTKAFQSVVKNFVECFESTPVLKEKYLEDMIELMNVSLTS